MIEIEPSRLTTTNQHQVNPFKSISNLDTRSNRKFLFLSLFFVGKCRDPMSDVTELLLVSLKGVCVNVFVCMCVCVCVCLKREKRGSDHET